MNLPNALTIGRIIAVPVVIWLIASGRYQAAFWCFVAAGVTDAVDGYLARRLNQRTALGAYLDPLADKALLVSIYLTLAWTGRLPLWLAILVVSRDVMIVGAVVLSWIMERPVAIRPLLVSKANTVAQIVFAAVVLGDLGFDEVDLSAVIGPLVVVTALLTAGSTAAYLVQWGRHMARAEPPRRPSA